MTTPPIMSVTDELIAELEREVGIARGIDHPALIHPDDLANILAERHRLNQQIAGMKDVLGTIADMYDHEASVGSMASAMYEAKCMARYVIDEMTT